MKEHFAGKCFANDEDLKDAGWINRWPHGMKRVYTNWCHGTTSVLMSTTMWNSRHRYVKKLVYSVSVLLLKNILVWWNVPYHLLPVQAMGPNNFEPRVQFSQWFIQNCATVFNFVQMCIVCGWGLFHHDVVFNSRNSHVSSDDSPHATLVSGHQLRFSINL